MPLETSGAREAAFEMPPERPVVFTLIDTLSRAYDCTLLALAMPAYQSEGISILLYVKPLADTLGFAAATLATRFQLTRREREILAAVFDAGGLSRVARRLGVSPHTVRTPVGCCCFRRRTNWRLRRGYPDRRRSS